MYLLAAVILLNTWIFTAFKLFGRFRINALQAITVNYWICVVTGIAAHGDPPFSAALLKQEWIYNAIFLGIFFIGLFNLLSYSTTTQGMTATTVANKLSLVIPVLFSRWVYHEQVGLVKILGIVLSIPAVYLSSAREEGQKMRSILLPAIIFICSGLLDTYIKYSQHFLLHDEHSQSGFTITAFGVAAALGTVLVLLRVWKRKDQLAARNLIAGILFGIPNYFSIYLFIRLLHSDFMQSSTIIPVNNIGIVVSTTFVAIFLFREKATVKRLSGIALAVISILLIALSDLNG